MKDRSPGRKRIAFVSTSAWTMYNFRKEVLQTMLENGFEVLVIAGHDMYAELLISMGCRFIPATIKNRSINPFLDIQLFLTLRGIYKKYRPDFVFHYVVKPNIYGTLAAGSFGIPCVAVITGLGHAFNKNGILKAIIKNLYRFSLQYASEVWCLNKEDAEYFVHHKIIPIQKLKVLPGEGVNVEHFKKNSVPKETKAPFTFLMCARLLKSKGILEYARATLILQKKNYIFHCVLLGLQEDHPDAISSEQIHKWKEEGGIKYLGFIDDVRDHLSNCDCFVYPSYYNEGVPRSLLEACSMKVPVITTNNPGCRELIQNGVNGLLCASQDRFELASKMEEMLLLDKVKRIEMGKKGREMVQVKYSIELVIKNYLLLLKSYFTEDNK